MLGSYKIDFINLLHSCCYYYYFDCDYYRDDYVDCDCYRVCYCSSLNFAVDSDDGNYHDHHDFPI